MLALPIVLAALRLPGDAISQLVAQLGFLYPAHFAPFCCLPGLSKLRNVGWRATVKLPSAQVRAQTTEIVF